MTARNTIVDGNCLYIEGQFPSFDDNLNELYIFLEHIIFLKFSDIYRREIENKSVTSQEYAHTVKETLRSNNIYQILMVDKNTNMSYYFDIDSVKKLDQFSDNIAECIFL